MPTRLFLIAIPLAICSFLLLTRLGILPLGNEANAPSPAQIQSAPDKNTTEAFIHTVMEDTNAAWRARFEAYDLKYQPPALTLFSKTADSECFAPNGESRSIPFYCPKTKTVFIDPAYLETVNAESKAKNHFASAYIIAHEVGHHVQNEWGILRDFFTMDHPESIEEKAFRSQGIEMMADCLAGIWAAQQNGFLKPADIETGIRAAMKTYAHETSAQGVVIAHGPASGTLDRRIEWFRRGYESGTLESCNTFWVE